jgi:hypothetical protein
MGSGQESLALDSHDAHLAVRDKDEGEDDQHPHRLQERAPPNKPLKTGGRTLVST